MRNTPLDHKRELLGILQDYAPNGPAQQLCSEMIWKAEDDGLCGKSLDRFLVGVLSDGLHHGNWPWTVAVRDE